MNAIRQSAFWLVMGLVVSGGQIEAARTSHAGEVPGTVGQTGAGQPGRPRADAAAPASIALDEFRRLHATGRVYVVDVRPRASFDADRIPGAVSVPLDAVAREAAAIARQAAGRAIVTYCSCPGDSASLAAARVLSEHGVPGARALAGGLTGWKKEG